MNTVNLKTIDANWTGAFSPEEIDQIHAVGESKQITEGILANGTSQETIRKSKVSWIYREDAPWIFDRLTAVASKLNSAYYGFDLSGISSLQYTIYEGDGGHYDWHFDINTGVDMNSLDYIRQRKLTLVMQLSDPSDYEGGDLELHAGKFITIEKGKGKIVAFPSWSLHRVTPVTSGVRKTLVAWFEGPDWR